MKTNLIKEVVRAQQRKKAYAVSQFGGKCQLCGYDKCIDALEFHHLNKKDKKFSPSQIINSWSWERALIELKKCILVCANCHREQHTIYKDTDLRNHLPSVIQTVCPNCNKKFSVVGKSQRYCSAKCARSFSRVVKERPSVKELTILLKAHNLEEIGRMYGISGNSVRKWAKLLNAGNFISS